MTATACVVCATPQDRWHVCPRCQDAIDHDLEEVLLLAALLMTSPVAFETIANPDGNARGKRIDAPAPGDLDVMAALDPRTCAQTNDDGTGDLVMHVGPVAGLESWAAAIREDYDLAPPRTPQPVTAIVVFLRAQWTRMCQDHPGADAFAHDVRRARDALDVAVRGPRSSRIKLGNCPVVVPATDTRSAYECGWPIWHDPLARTIRCRGCGSSWTDEHGWAHLAALFDSRDAAAS